MIGLHYLFYSFVFFIGLCKWVIFKPHKPKNNVIKNYHSQYYNNSIKGLTYDQIKKHKILPPEKGIYIRPY